jgi:hypothetical protein
LNGQDPVEDRRAKEAAQAAEKAVAEASTMTFKRCCEAYISAHRAGWSDPKSETQWRSSLATYAWPILGDLPVAAIDDGLVLRCLNRSGAR